MVIENNKKKEKIIKMQRERERLCQFLKLPRTDTGSRACGDYILIFREWKRSKIQQEQWPLAADNNNNHLSNSLVFGLRPQTKK